MYTMYLSETAQLRKYQRISKYDSYIQFIDIIIYHPLKLETLFFSFLNKYDHQP